MSKTKIEYVDDSNKTLATSLTHILETGEAVAEDEQPHRGHRHHDHDRDGLLGRRATGQGSRGGAPRPDLGCDDHDGTGFDNRYDLERRRVTTRTRRNESLDSIREWARVAARAADEKKGLDTVVLQVGEVLVITDFFVISSAPNSRQVRTIVEAVEATV